MNRTETTPEFSLYAKLIFGKRASSNLSPARLASNADSDGGDRSHVLSSSSEPADGDAAAPEDARSK
jgi:hypothetical protein